MQEDFHLRENLFKNKSLSLKQIVEIGLFLATGIILTTVIKIPISVGFIHLGDLGLFIALCFINGKKHIHVAFAFAIMLSDFILGFVIYTPISFLTRIVIIFTSWILNKGSLFHHFIWILIPLNYFLYDFVIFGEAIAIEFLLFNFLQIVPIYLVLFPTNIFHFFRKKEKMISIHSSKFEKLL